MDEIDCVVVGAGVVGLAIARALALAGREVIVLESAEAIGTCTSSRNSEVVHAGIYYPAGSLMARFCVAGRHALYDYAHARGVSIKKCGKLIVATDAREREKLAGIAAHAAANGVDDMEMLSHNEALDLEPELNCVAALLSPSSGIVDSHAYMLALQGDAENAGAVFSFNSPVLGMRVVADGFEVDVGGAEPVSLACRKVVNAAGLDAPALARRIAGLEARHVPQAYLAKGNYFVLSGRRAPFSRLIYPVPVPGGLGTHLTIDLGGQAKFGPDVEWIEAIDYGVDPSRATQFYAAIRRYWPGLRDGDLAPGYAGIRPKIAPQGSPSQDFVIQGESAHGVPGLINLFGIESPGLTASLAIADHIAGMAAA